MRMVARKASRKNETCVSLALLPAYFATSVTKKNRIALDVTTTFGEVAEWSKAFIRWTCNSLPERQILEFPLMPSKPLGGLKCPAPHVMKSECGPQTHLQREMSDEEWEETVESR
ncbi:unnamed protein product, partial [Amoebophrya sp. A25]|eukprot:GSA25T00022042001.1